MYQNGNRNKQNKPGNKVAKDFYNPYAFVSLSDKVCYLGENEVKELEQIKDAPVKDGLSGKIKVRFKAVTPFCVRDASGNNANVEGRYFVPGSSLKGMIRNVFEILTYSNIRNSIANSRYSMRDLRSPDYELKQSEHPQHGGFLMQINGDFFIQACESTQLRYFDRHNHDDIQSKAIFKEGKNSRDLQNARKVKDKYDTLKTPFDKSGKGMWFFSGYMGGNPKFEKKHEFLFEIPKLDYELMLPLEEDEYNDFIFIHEKENENEAWKFWKRKLKNYSSVEEIVKDGYKGIVPCFFRTKDDGKAVRDLGFSFLYRQPYPNTIHYFLPEQMKREGIDLTQAVFGYAGKKDALRGRVQFGNAFVENAHPLDGERTFILGSPKPTYYPFYLEQNGSGKLNTYFSSNTRISGYKRFLLKDVADAGVTEKSRVTSSFVPIDAGAEFVTTVYFHNLHNYELGALLSAITFYRQSDRCHHVIGYAKPFGYGRLKVESCALELETGTLTIDQLYSAFIEKICERCQCNEQTWAEDMSDLFTIARGNYQPKKSIRYPKMKDTKKGQYDDEFAAIKTSNFRLSDFDPLN